ncbi:hypothetical protein GC173_13090 [bacterium]|nr:hypothetical protein [bacterium]
MSETTHGVERHDPANRRFPRYTCNLPAILDIMVPEQTFSPKNVPAACLDLSRTGCRLTCRKIDSDYYRMLMQELRYVKLEIDLLDGRLLRLRGKLVWVDYAREESSLGIMFVSLDEEQLEVLDELLVAMEAAGLLYQSTNGRPVSKMPMDLDLELD